MFILSSPSGAGKTTVSRMLLEADGEIGLSVSVTTRPRRKGEVDGKDYIFVDQADFEKRVEAGEFLEWAEVFGHLYGTPKAEIKAGLKEGRDFLFDIDWQGTQQLYQRMEVDVVRVFLLPPSIDELEQRLRSRATDSEEVIAARMARARAVDSPRLARTLDQTRSMQAGLVRTHFTTELGSLTPARGDDLVMLIDSMTSFEAWDLLRTTHRRSRPQIRRAWLVGLKALCA